MLCGDLLRRTGVSFQINKAKICCVLRKAELCGNSTDSSQLRGSCLPFEEEEERTA